MSETGSGLQAERTRLAWDRTALSFATYGALLFHSGHIPGIAVIVSGFAVLVLGRLRYRRLIACLRRGEPMPRPRALSYIAALTAGTILLSATVSFTAH